MPVAMAAKVLFLQPTLTPSLAFQFQSSYFPYSSQNLLSISTSGRYNSPLGGQSPSSSFSLFQNKSNFFLSHSPPNKSKSTPPFTIKSELNFPLISPRDIWGTWTVLFTTAAFSIWLEKTKNVSASGGALVSILIGLAASNLGFIPFESPAYSIVLEYMLPLAFPLLLFKADLRRVCKSNWTLLPAFLLGSVSKTIGTILAFMTVPMQSLRRDIAFALMGRHTGGVAKYIATANAQHISSLVLNVALAADNLAYAIYFTILFALASRIPPESSMSTTDVSGDVDVDVDEGSNGGEKLTVVQLATALAVAFAIYKTGTFLTNYMGIPGGRLPAITAIAITLITALPRLFNKLVPAGEAMALILIHVFFTVVGAGGNMWLLKDKSRSIFMFSFVELTVHLALILGLGLLFRLDLKVLLLASNANVGDSSTVCGMATAKGWSSLIVPVILASIFRNAIGML